MADMGNLSDGIHESVDFHIPYVVPAIFEFGHIRQRGYKRQQARMIAFIFLPFNAFSGFFYKHIFGCFIHCLFHVPGQVVRFSYVVCYDFIDGAVDDDVMASVI